LRRRLRGHRTCGASPTTTGAAGIGWGRNGGRSEGLDGITSGIRTCGAARNRSIASERQISTLEQVTVATVEEGLDSDVHSVSKTRDARSSEVDRETEQALSGNLEERYSWGEGLEVLRVGTGGQVNGEDPHGMLAVEGNETTAEGEVRAIRRGSQIAITKVHLICHVEDPSRSGELQLEMCGAGSDQAAQDEKGCEEHSAKC